MFQKKVIMMNKVIKINQDVLIVWVVKQDI